MSKSISPLGQAVAALTRRARALGLTDSEWANRAGLWQETLSRLRRREACDFETQRQGAQRFEIASLAAAQALQGLLPQPGAIRPLAIGQSERSRPAGEGGHGLPQRTDRL